jgi:hypothetical protein
MAWRQTVEDAHRIQAEMLAWVNGRQECQGQVCEVCVIEPFCYACTTLARDLEAQGQAKDHVL